MAGRKTLFKPEYVKQAAKLCLLGATDAQMADFFGVGVSTFSLWKVRYPELSEALKANKDEADKRVVSSLFHRAMGYEHDEVDIRVVGGEIVKTPIRKYYPPDTTACIFWLKNRQSADWRDKVDHTVEGGDKPIQHSIKVSFE